MLSNDQGCLRCRDIEENGEVGWNEAKETPVNLYLIWDRIRIGVYVRVYKCGLKPFVFGSHSVLVFMWASHCC